LSATRSHSSSSAFVRYKPVTRWHRSNVNGAFGRAAAIAISRAPAHDATGSAALD